MSHKKPFDLAHAMAGAPIVQRNGEPLRFVAYSEEADPSCCVVVIERSQLIGTRRNSGRVNELGTIDNPRDAFMAPLGMVEGRPVFVGDELVRRSTPKETPKGAAPTDHGPFTGWIWPAPAKVYPETTMSLDALGDAFNSAKDFGSVVKSIKAVANAALRHAIDAGQIISMADHVDAIAELAQNMVDAGAARDLAIAVAVHSDAIAQIRAFGEKACADYMSQYPRGLAAIIAQVK